MNDEPHLSFAKEKVDSLRTQGFYQTTEIDSYIVVLMNSDPMRQTSQAGNLRIVQWASC